MIVPIFETLRLAFFQSIANQSVFVGLANFATLFLRARWRINSGMRLATTFTFPHPHGRAESGRHSARRDPIMPHLRARDSTDGISCRRCCPSSSSASVGN